MLSILLQINLTFIHKKINQLQVMKPELQIKGNL